MALCTVAGSIARVAGNWDWSQPAVHVSDFVRYPGYWGGLNVHGTVTLAGGSGHQRLTWRLKGLDSACKLGAGGHVKNGCGIHVHTGTSCNVDSKVGGHYFSSSLTSDPWAPVVYVSDSDGTSVQDEGVSVATGLSNEDILGRVVVVHELNSGARIACGLIQSADNACAGYTRPVPNTDVDGVLLAKIWSPTVDHCCALCSQRSECEGYVFHLDQCYLKKNLGEFSHKEGAMTRFKMMRRNAQLRGSLGSNASSVFLP